MKIALGSDLHLEFGSLTEVRNREDAQVLILSGDVLVAQHFVNSDYARAADRYHEFFEQCQQEFPHTVYIMGNHEHYHGDFKTTREILREALSPHSAVHDLECETWQHQDLTFVGATLWTDCNQGDPLTLWELTRGMNDYRIVSHGDDHRLLPETTAEVHARTLEFLDQTTAQPGNYVVVGHHAPSRRSCHPRYSLQHHMNGGYSSNLDSWIEARPQIRLWTHGHTHDNYDYVVGQTRVVCNPRGYVGYEARAQDWDFQYLQLAEA